MNTETLETILNYELSANESLKEWAFTVETRVEMEKQKYVNKFFDIDIRMINFIMVIEAKFDIECKSEVEDEELLYDCISYYPFEYDCERMNINKKVLDRLITKWYGSYDKQYKQYRVKESKDVKTLETIIRIIEQNIKIIDDLRNNGNLLEYYVV